MTAVARWTPKARQSLKEIATYVARKAHRPVAADQLVDAIYEKCQLYADQQEVGSRHPALPEGFRCFLHKRYVVVFEIVDNGIVVHLVVDGARDWPRLFRDLPSQ